MKLAEKSASRTCAPNAGKARSPRANAPVPPALSPLRRMVLITGASLGLLAFTTAPALAAAPEAPTTEPVTGITATTATFHGFLNPNALTPGEAGQYEFLYKQSASECEGASKAPEPPGTALGFEHEEVPAQEVTGLTPHTEYTVCLLARNLTAEQTVGAAVSFKTALPPETPTTEPATAVTATTATFNGVLNPGAPGDPGSYEFRYRASASECEGESGLSAPEPAGGSLGAKEEAVSTPVSGLVPATQYTFCVLARNAAGETALGSPVTFTTPAAAPAIEGEWATEVASTSATLNAQIDPGGADTKYRFEYDTSEYSTSATHGKSLEGDAAEGTAAVSVAVHLQDLSPGTTYHYRVVATSSVETVVGPDRTLVTQATGVPFALPDDRQYELVSPPDKHGTEPVPIGGVPAANGGIVQAAENGSAITYLTGQPPELDPPANAWSNQLIARRGGEGWASQDISLPNSVPIGGISDGAGALYKAFSADLSSGLSLNDLRHPAQEAPLDPFAPAGYMNEYLRDNDTHDLRALLQSTPELSAAEFQIHFVDATPDLKHIVVEMGTGGQSQLYEWTAGAFQPISVLPGGGQPNQSVVGATSVGDQPVSADGSRVVWTDLDNQALYMRKNIGTPQAETVQVDAPQEGISLSATQGDFKGMSSDGSRVFFTSGQKLTLDSTVEEGFPELYEFDVNTGHLRDLTVDHSDANGAQVLGVVGISEDGSYVYFVANGALGSKAPAGNCIPANGNSSSLVTTCNLFVWHEGEMRLIATLSESDNGEGPSTATPSVGRAGDWEVQLYLRTARVSRDGRSLIFMSRRPLTNYDNTMSSGTACGHARTTGRPFAVSCEEVFRFDAGTSGLSCLSCNPTGARPTGPSNIPGATSYENNRAVYMSRALSSSGGRVFFESADALVPSDTNGTVDVYQWEQDGEGSCRQEGGCVSLISSGKDSDESLFLDASADGSDVFFWTRAQLTRADFDHAFDVYDAHVCGAHGVECLAEPAAQPPPCTTGDACRPAPAPQPGVFGAPASATFAGAGNLRPAGPPTVKRLTNAQKLAKALRTCRVKHSRHRRRVCEAQARKRYGPRSSRSAHTHRRGK